MSSGRRAAVLALGLPGGDVARPVGVVERDQLAVLHGRVLPDRGRVRFPQEHASEPVPLHLSHVAYKPVQRQLRRWDRPRLAPRVVEALALEQQGHPVELEPGLEHLALGEHERWLRAARI